MIGNVKRLTLFLVVLLSAAAFIFSGFGIAQTVGLTPIEQLGEFLYFDEDLSEPSGQSCASCHLPDVGFDDPEDEIPVSEGVIPGLFGGRNSPSSAYAMYAPIRYFDDKEKLWIGGQFWDSRAHGEVLGDPLADQALGPFLNPVEMNNIDKLTVIRDVALSIYKDLYETVWPLTDLDAWEIMTDEEIDTAYDQVALSIAAFERTQLFGQFSSKYDFYLQTCLADGGDMDDCAMGIGDEAAAAGTATFSSKEWYGLQLFMSENNNDGVMEPGEGAMCAACHVADWIPDPGNVVVPTWAPDNPDPEAVGKMVPPVFTDLTYDNLGVPKSNHKLLRDNLIDLGLGPVVGDPEENGKFKVMPLRNIQQTKPYAHNGFFKNLKDIVHFYNTRDVPGALKKGEDWPEPEYQDTINMDELGNLGLSDKDEDALVKFMKTLSDGWRP